jgi:hypothetical protein
MISTRNLDALPDVPSLRRLTRSLAMLDAILSPEWEGRYYSFDSHWGSGELMASMRNGQGDHWFALFSPHGVVMIGLDHEAPMFRYGNPWPGLFEGVPADLAYTIDEPAFEAQHSTFCIWRRTEGAVWERGPLEFSKGDDPDGSAQLLQHLDGLPETCRDFAAEYYERDVALDAVSAIYRHESLTEALVRSLNDEVSLDDVESDRASIGYPDSR